ncbi:MAG: hypothetical protein LQ341_002036 [Variospora aurantia]|nr:MAG: hypothetical protein LQ341_002036 [Variospora aurantia]
MKRSHRVFSLTSDSLPPHQDTSQQEQSSENTIAAFRTPISAFIPASDLCHDVACPSTPLVPSAGSGQSLPRRGDYQTPDETELLANFDVVHGGWATIPVKKQAARKSCSKRPEQNWQAAKQAGPRLLIIGKGKKAEATAIAVVPEQAPVRRLAEKTSCAKTIATAAPAYIYLYIYISATSVTDDSRSGGVKIDGAKDVYI